MTSTPLNEKAPTVLLVCGAFAPERCGVGDYTRRLARELADQGVHVHVMTSTDSTGESGVGLHAVVDRWDSPTRVHGQLDKVLSAVQPDIVQIQYPGSYGTANRALSGNLLPHWARRHGIRVCTTLHEWGERSLRWRLRAGFMVARSHGVVAVTSADAVRLAVVAGLSSTRVYHIPLGPNLEFDLVPSARSPRPVLAFFGFLHPMKGLEELLEAAALLQAQGTDFRLDLHGHFAPELSDHHAAIQGQVTRLGIQSVVRFPGSLPGAGEAASCALSEAWLGVLPFREGVSERRSSFLVLGRLGLPVLTSPGPWQPKWLVDGANVFLEPLVPATWADRIARLCSDPKLLQAVGSRSRAEILERHSWPAVARSHLEFWKHLA